MAGLVEELDLATHGLRYLDCDPWGFAPAPSPGDPGPDGRPPRSVLADPSVGPDVVVVNSFSKYFGMTGWRLGWCILPPDMVDVVDVPEHGVTVVDVFRAYTGGARAIIERVVAAGVMAPRYQAKLEAKLR